jgi:4-alpha-glucanotransferase
VSAALHRLAVAHDIVLDYRDVWGHVHRVPDDALRAILSAMRVDAGSEQAIRDALLELPRARCRQCLPPLTVVRAHLRPWRVPVHLAVAAAGQRLEWRVVAEDGTEHHLAIPSPSLDRARPVDCAGEHYVALELALDVPLQSGYHGLDLRAGGHCLAQAMLAVAPRSCYRPVSLQGGRRLWGAAVQLYGLRSARNWGIGDFTDLASFIRQWGAQGAGVVGVNPLHALFPDAPAQASPYSPSSRMFLNILYLDVEAIAEFAHCAKARAHVRSAAFQAGVAALREAPLVDYAGVAAAKMPVLEMLYEQARLDARADATSARWTAFDAFRTAGGEALRRHALFEALQAHFSARDAAVWGWPAWPAAYRNPAAPAITQFADENAERIDFHAWLQWQAQLQRESVAEAACRARLAVGLYTDLAVSIDRGGAEAWASQDLYAMTASVGAPPDVFNVHGQDWGLPPMIPRRLRDAGYAPFIATLRANMRDAGALRIDHVMGMLRLYWVPSGAMAADGAYVRYPLDDLLGLLALESERHRCLVIGEDLGTVPDEVRYALAANDVLSYRVLLFERDAAGEFKPPSAYPEASLAVASTHDLPTLAGWWAGRDILLRAEHGQLARDADVDAQIAERIDDRGRMLGALARAGLLPDGMPLDPRAAPELTPSLAAALQIFLARTPAALFIVQAEDVFGMLEQANLPGTTTAHPNWRRKLPDPVGYREVERRLLALATRIAAERPRNGA